MLLEKGNHVLNRVFENIFNRNPTIQALEKEIGVLDWEISIAFLVGNFRRIKLLESKIAELNGIIEYKRVISYMTYKIVSIMTISITIMILLILILI